MPHGRKFFTLSFDDGITQDRRIIELCKKHGFGGCTFNINTGLCGESWAWVGESLGRPDVSHIRFTESELRQGVYDGFDVQVHTLTHPSLKAFDSSPQELAREINGDARNILEFTGHRPSGLAWPGGDGEYTGRTVELVLQMTDMRFARATAPTYRFDLPECFMDWHPTCSIIDPELPRLAEEFIDLRRDGDSLFFVWGHGYELDIYDAYDRLEQLIIRMTSAPDIECVSSGELFQIYKNAIPSQRKESI